MSQSTRSQQVETSYDRLLATHPGVRRRFVDAGPGRRIHLLETGDGPPALFLHGGSTSSLSLLPLFRHLRDVGVVAVDRPGFGLSDPAPESRSRYREAAISFVDTALDRLGLDAPVLAGQSGGGLWALWYALARPERVRSLILLGSVPLLPGTRPSAPLRVAATPVVSELLSRLVRPTPARLVALLSSVGEGDTIVRYPDLIDAIVTGAGDPVAAATNRAELRALIHPFGFRRGMYVRPEELRRLAVPTLIIWGDHDPIGSVEVAQAVTRLIPHGRLELLPAGHVPYFGHPERVAELVTGFVRHPGA